MGDYNNVNSTVLATSLSPGHNKTALLLRKYRSGRLEYIIAEKFEEFAHPILGDCAEYSWKTGKHFDDIETAMSYWTTEILGEEGHANIGVIRSEEFDGGVPLNGKTIQSMWRDFANAPCDNYGNLCQPFCGWPRGTHHEDIWHWFDWQYREHGGVAALISL